MPPPTQGTVNSPINSPNLGIHSVSWSILPAGGLLTRVKVPSPYQIARLGMMIILDYRNYTYAKFGKAILKQPGGYAFQIWDTKVIGSLRQEEYGDGIVKKILADSVEELAEKLAVNGLEAKEELVRVIQEYNNAVRRHQAENPDKTWNPAVKDGMSTCSLALPKSNWALTIEEPPFMAVKVACGITFTFGGLAIDPETAEVISNETSKGIPGLFCCGEMVGLFWENYPGGSGLMAGAVFGRKAGRAAANLIL